MRAYQFALLACTALAGCGVHAAGGPGDGPVVDGHDDMLGPLLNDAFKKASPYCSLDGKRPPIKTSKEQKVVDGSTLAFQLHEYPKGLPLKASPKTLSTRINGTVMLNDWTYSIAKFYVKMPGSLRVNGTEYPFELSFAAQNDAGAMAVVVFPVRWDESEKPVRPGSFLGAVLGKPTEADPDITTSGLNHTELQYHVSQSDVHLVNDAFDVGPCLVPALLAVVADPLAIHSPEFGVLMRILARGHHI